MRGMIYLYVILINKSEGKGPLEIPWDDIIKMDLTDIWCEAVDSVQLSQNKVQWRAVVNTVINFRINKGETFTDCQFIKKDGAPWSSSRVLLLLCVHLPALSEIRASSLIFWLQYRLHLARHADIAANVTTPF
jgi:hypothetical protein